MTLVGSPVRKFPVKQLQGKYCLSPFVMIEVTLNGDVRLCGCGAWMPITIGNLKQQTLESMLASDLAKDIRQSIIDGTYQYCNEKLCGVLANNTLNSIDSIPPEVKEILVDPSKFLLPHHISFQGDRTCNLSCPSCRRTVIKTPERLLDSQRQVGQLIYQNLFSKPTIQRIVLETSGTGEFFASELLISFASSINRLDFPNLKLHIGTNGLLAPSRWHKIKHLDPIIEKVTVSVDAANPDTYEQLRRGGKWSDLLSALAFLQEKKHSNKLTFHTRMIVQKQNYQEMEDFYHFSKSFDVDVVEYSRLTNWGTWTSKEFSTVDVFNSAHPEHLIAQQQLKEVKKLSDTWFAGL
jgi:sulfatase maturation enzyme AslB (radical SAM superfamily)